MESVRYGVGSWKAEGLGNHRAVVRVAEWAAAVRVRIPWRRRDGEPEKKGIIVVDAATGKRVADLVRGEIRRECGEIVFRPVSGPGEYYVYFMPFVQEGWQHMPSTRYLPPQETADPEWVARHGLGEARQRAALPQAAVVELQAVGEFHRMDPMEVAATGAEVAEMVGRRPGCAYLVFPEDRRYPIRMRDALPLRWVDMGPGREVSGTACRGEFFAFQLGIFAVAGPLEEVEVVPGEWHGPGGRVIPAGALRCFSTGGVDWLGRPFGKRVAVDQGRVQPLWLGVQVPEDALPGWYEGKVVVRPRGQEQTRVRLVVEVVEERREDGGDGELWRQARLRWLDSTKGLDEEEVEPYASVRVEGKTVEILGRVVRVGESGLPEGIATRFDPSLQSAAGEAQEMLAGPVRLVALVSGQAEALAAQGCAVVAQHPGAVCWQARAEGERLAYDGQAKLECDGYITCRIALKARAAVAVEDLRLEIPMRREFAKYMMGMGYKGGRRQGDWQWQWSADRANHMIWLGEVHGGLQCKLMYEEEVWELYNLRNRGLPASWDNNGRGGCTVVERDGRVELVAYSGARQLAAGEEVVFRFGLLITPFHPLDRGHWDWRYYGDGLERLRPMAEVAAAGARVRHLHHGNELNPHINYPFVRAAALQAYVAEAHARGMRLVIYYTVRELSNFAAELWAFRSLGGEIYRRGEGFRLADPFAEGDASAGAEEERPAGLLGKGGAWLWEHLADDFVPAWHHPLGENLQDAAIATQGLSRLHNYYVEGLDYLARQVGVDGIYLDGIGYDRQIMKRVRKVLKRARADSLVTFHSGNNFHPEYGLNSPAVQYLEHLPYCDSVWFGEGYDYDAGPDYWLVEISGIPFGLSGEMLQGGGNRWRGMLYYGMANRLGWNPQSRPEGLWRFWDESGIAGMEMFGYWDDRCPVRTGREEVLATVYRGKGRVVVALASWAAEEVECSLEVDRGRLGIDPEQAVWQAPAIEGFQAARGFGRGERIPVAPGKGWVLVIEEGPGGGGDSARASGGTPSVQLRNSALGPPSPWAERRREGRPD